VHIDVVGLRVEEEIGEGRDLDGVGEIDLGVVGAEDAGAARIDGDSAGNAGADGDRTIGSGESGMDVEAGEDAGLGELIGGALEGLSSGQRTG
jgi:hypothetical protein